MHNKPMEFQYLPLKNTEITETIAFVLVVWFWFFCSNNKQLKIAQFMQKGAEYAQNAEYVKNVLDLLYLHFSVHFK